MVAYFQRMHKDFLRRTHPANDTLNPKRRRMKLPFFSPK